MRALDLGAAGVIVPLVSSAEEAGRAARACRTRPTESAATVPSGFPHGSERMLTTRTDRSPASS